VKRKDRDRELLEEAERIDRDEIGLTDHEGEGRWIFVRARPPKEPSQIYSVRLPVSSIEQLRQLAASEGEGTSSLLRAWILERLDQELKALEGQAHRRARRQGGGEAERKSARLRRASGP
jgi:hypothetical protein